GQPGSLAFYDVSGNEVLTGTDVKDAQAGTQSDSLGNAEYVVSLTLTDEGAQKFAEATKAALPNNDPIYIVYDGAIISMPTVQAEITDGKAVITGMTSAEAAQNLASTIRIGGLNLELEELQSNVVGAQLGETAIDTALKAGAIGFCIVAVFMVIIYFLPGFAAAIALAMYVALMIILLAAFEMTLTLPGIAGIILGIGMAVDANIIVFARIREELATGKTVKSATKIGYQKALTAILDGNVTTLIAAAILGMMGTGTIKGFAQTLALGIILSMFTALVITRILMNAINELGLDKVKLYGVKKDRKPINFVGKRKAFFAISILLILVGVAFMGIHGSRGEYALNYSLDFIGGTQTTVDFGTDYTLDQLDSEVVPKIEEITGDANVQVQKVSNSTQVIFKTRTLTVDERSSMNSMLESDYGLEESSITAETISSTISSEMRSDAILAVLVAAICIMLYVWIRFSDLRFGASAIVALLHDVLVTLAFYAVVRVSVGSTFIACMLTLVGYSINDTIVVFDRIRENLKPYGNLVDGEKLTEIVNTSVSQTLTRSVFTSITTVIMVACLYIFGVSSIREFALPLMIGIVCGTYSSVCIASPLWFVLRTKLVKKEKASK
ncbi:MAG: protein translocase subunit SecD, partial [Lachnospiraceae bacterium]|nr:protein translocase subunit SecD [Lachnospiraceae bacterium]